MSTGHTSREPATPGRDAPQFVQDRPADIHAPRPAPWHRYGYHIRTLTRRIWALTRELRIGSGDRLLDYGCADVPYRHFLPDVDYVPADLPGNPNAALVLNADGTVPAETGSFDAVLSTQVLEHVEDPALYLSECFRALRPGGRMLLTTHGTFVYHPDPDDYWRWTCAGLQKAVRDAGFEVVRFEGVIGLLPTGLQLAQDAIYWQLPRPLRPLLATFMQALIALTDRLHSPGSRSYNSQVFAVVAEKP